MNLNSLDNMPRLLLEADLRPVAGQRFQPTGFADLGAAEYKLPDGTLMLLVESAQSVANRLEKTCLDGDGPGLDPALAGLPYVIAELEGPGIEKSTSSLVEAHRIASPYILLNKEFQSTLVKEMGYNPKLPLEWKKIYATLFRYDVNSLVHGVFLSLLEGGRVRAPRAVTGFIEASNVVKVVSGGVKNSPVDPTGKTQVADAKAGESGVYSNVPYSRVEYVAKEIKAYFNLDLSLIRGYRLGEGATRFLIALSLLKVRRFLDSSLRLRTACDLELVGDVRAKAPVDFVLPSESELLAETQAGIKACAALFANPPVTILKTKVKVVEKKDGDKAAGASAA
jgi:CRISPR-associated protein Csb1